MTRTFILAGTFASILSLSACVAETPAVPGEEDQCGAAAQQNKVGQSRDTVVEGSFAGPVRVIAPGQPVTMDFNAERINFETDDAGLIVRVFCG